jgi:dCMP deaminase
LPTHAQDYATAKENSLMTFVDRPPWDEYFLQLAGMVATRSTCPRLAVGAILVGPDHRVLSTGYNGVRAGDPHCSHLLGNTVPCERAVHAERNALFRAVHYGTPAGCTLYVTHSPCQRCQQLIVQTRVERVVFHQVYGHAGFEILDNANNITVQQGALG